MFPQLLDDGLGIIAAGQKLPAFCQCEGGVNYFFWFQSRLLGDNPFNLVETPVSGLSQQPLAQLMVEIGIICTGLFFLAFFQEVEYPLDLSLFTL